MMTNESVKRQTSLDELLWLEAAHDERAGEWARQQTRETVERLTAPSLHGQVNRELEQTLAGSPREPAITLIGNAALRILTTDEHRYGLLQIGSRDGAGVPGRWRTVLDMDALRKRTGISYELIEYWLPTACLPPDYRRCLLRLAPGGSAEVEVREFDLETGEFVEHGFHVSQCRVIIEWLNRDLVLVAHTSDPAAPRTAAGGAAEVRLWRRGESLSCAQVIYRAAATDSLVWLFAAGLGNARYGVINRVIDFSTFELLLVHQDGRIEQVPVPKDCIKAWRAADVVQAGPRALYFQLRRATELEGQTLPSNSVVSYAVDPSIPENERTRLLFTPSEADIIDGPSVATRDELAFVVTRQLVPRVVVVSMGSAMPVRDVVCAEAGRAITRLSGDHSSNDVLVTIEGFVHPAVQSLHRHSRPVCLAAKDIALFDGAGYTTEIATATSRDGTPIDYFLLRPRACAWQGPQPLLVTGYAAFGLSFTPTYFSHQVGGPSLKLWLERGGSLVVPIARGGGERGDAWHRAAMRELRQNSYDDFVAVIEHLNQIGYTAPHRTGVFGMSNGGLLAAVLGTQRPDLFGAVVSDVPLTDMIRMKYMGMGAAWLHEYGDPEDPAILEVLEGYSPLHNVRSGVGYPPFLITISTEDCLVGPGHARKLAARLGSVGATVYFYESSEGGHGVSDPYRNPELMALRMTFLIDNLMKQMTHATARP